jgi:hypothetical protein
MSVVAHGRRTSGKASTDLTRSTCFSTPGGIMSIDLIRVAWEFDSRTRQSPLHGSERESLQPATTYRSITQTQYLTFSAASLLSFRDGTW